MHLEVARTDFVRLLDRIYGAIQEKGLSKICFSAAEGTGHLKASAVDKVISVFCEVPCHVKTSGTIAISAKLFFEIVRALDDETIALKCDDNVLKILYGPKFSSRITLPTVAVSGLDSEPVRAEPTWWMTVASDKLAYMINQVHFCIAHESPRNYAAVGYVDFQKPGAFRLVGTDGFRLSYSEASPESPVQGEVQNFCLSKRCLMELYRMASSGAPAVELAGFHDNKMISASIPGYRLFLSGSATKFPSYSGVVPDGQDGEMVLPRSVANQVAKRLLLVTDRSNALKFAVHDRTLTIAAGNHQSSDGHEMLPAPTATKDSTFVVNGRFLLDSFSGMTSSEISIKFSSREDPIQVSPSLEPHDCRSKHVLVPIRDSSDVGN